MRTRTTGLNLVVAAIIILDTVYLERALEVSGKRRDPIWEDLVPHRSSPGWEHINLTGDCAWS